MSALGAHVHDHLLRLPGAAAVGAAHQPDVDVLLQIATRATTHVVGTQQRPPGRSGQRRDPVGVHSIVEVLPQGQADPQPQAVGLVDRPNLTRRRLDLHARAIHVVIQVRITLKSTRNPKMVLPLLQSGMTGNHHPLASHRHRSPKPNQGVEGVAPKHLDHVDVAAVVGAI